jgi:hypothetical protein
MQFDLSVKTRVYGSTGGFTRFHSVPIRVAGSMAGGLSGMVLHEKETPPTNTARTIIGINFIFTISPALCNNHILYNKLQHKARKK